MQSEKANTALCLQDVITCSYVLMTHGQPTAIPDGNVIGVHGIGNHSAK